MPERTPFVYDFDFAVCPEYDCNQIMFHTAEYCHYHENICAADGCINRCANVGLCSIHRQVQCSHPECYTMVSYTDVDKKYYDPCCETHDKCLKCTRPIKSLFERSNGFPDECLECPGYYIKDMHLKLSALSIYGETPDP
jgi:hypothetical protein